MKEEDYNFTGILNFFNSKCSDQDKKGVVSVTDYNILEIPVYLNIT